MALHNKVGTDGEMFACNYLQQNGYKILHRNWRFNHKELDIEATEGDILAFVEVKTRSTDKWENPRDAITDTKIRFLVEAAEAYIYKYNRCEEVRFDVLTLICVNGGFEVELIREAFHP